jgi:aquaglyceroporin related protein
MAKSDFNGNHDISTGTGDGPTLQDPNDSIQRSNQANSEHVEKASRAVGAGPALRNRVSTGSGSRNSAHEKDLHHDDTYAHNGSEQQLSPAELEHQHTLNSVRNKLGLPQDAPIVQGHEVHHHLAWSSIRVLLREPFAEFLGTFVLVMFGNGSVAQVLLSTGQAAAPGGGAFGNYQSINWGWGLGVMLGIYVAGDSGGFLNPAVTLGFCLYRKLPWRRFPVYLVAQFLGGFVGSGVVYANYINAINNFEGHGIRTVPPSKTATAGIFCTYPQAFLTITSQFFSEFIASAILMLVIFALKDDSNPGAMGKSGAGSLFPLALLFLIFGLGACFGWETGYAINFARDFGPRLMSYILGYGPEVWTAGHYYFWVPIVAPFCGCAFGGFLYDAFVYTGPGTSLLLG